MTPRSEASGSGAARGGRPAGALLRLSVIAGVAVAVLVLQRRRRARRYVEPRSVHTLRNLAVAGLSAATVHLVERPLVAPLARAAEARRRGLVWLVPAPAWARDALAVLLLDYTLYLWHILVHRVPALWRFHLVHHVDLDLDASTGLRFHAGEIASSVPWRAAQVFLIGASPRALTAWQTLTIVSVLFHHSNTRLSGSVERVLSWFVATPKMHAIHHSIDPAQLHSNFSSGLAVWDRLHGTARFDADPATVTVGVAGRLDPRDAALARILTLPFSPRALQAPSHSAPDLR
jgi:sterol desaturase/sphingolipid hydroxylase (fatty acid hydroxylase superfamily)